MWFLPIGPLPIVHHDGANSAPIIGVNGALPVIKGVHLNFCTKRDFEIAIDQ